MTSERATSRWAGFLYLIVVITGIFSLMYVPSRITVSGDAAATLSNILAHESLFRFGIAAFLVKQVAFLLLPLVLYRLFRPVDHNAAVLMVALAVVGVPIALVSLTHRLDALSILTDPSLQKFLAPERAQEAATLALRSYRNGLFVTNLFWGLWLIPFGYLVAKSRFLPKIIGIVLILGGLGYLVNLFGELLLPGYSDTAWSNYVMLPAAIGEISACFWLLIAGVRPTPQGAPA